MGDLVCFLKLVQLENTIGSSKYDKESACNEGYPGSIPGLGRSPGQGHGYLLQYSCLENSMDREPSGLQSVGLQTAGHNWVINRDIILLLQGKQLRIFIASNNIKAFKQKSEVWKTSNSLWEHNSFPVLYFLIRSVVILKNGICLCCVMKCINIWKIYKTQWMNIF